MQSFIASTYKCSLLSAMFYSCHSWIESRKLNLNLSFLISPSLCPYTQLMAYIQMRMLTNRYKCLPLSLTHNTLLLVVYTLKVLGHLLRRIINHTPSGAHFTHCRSFMLVIYYAALTQNALRCILL